MSKSNRPAFLNESSAPVGPDPIHKQWKAFIVGLGVFVLIVGICAVLYFRGSPYGWGIKSTFDVTSHPDLWTCVYFSIITISTVGYGDFRPESWSRLISSCEAIFGLLLMGWLVSELVSKQTGRLQELLVKSILNREAQDFLDEIQERREEIEGLAVISGSISAEPLLDKTQGLLKAVGRYWRHASTWPDLKKVAQTKACNRMLGEFERILARIEEIFAHETYNTISKSNHDSIRAITENILTVSAVFEDYIADKEFLPSFAAIYPRVNQLRTQLILRQHKQ